MKLDGLRRSRNVEDRRGGMGRRVVGGGGFLAVALMAAGFFFPQYAPVFDIISSLAGGGGVSGSRTPGEPIDDQHNAFASATLGLTEDVWSTLFQEGVVPRASGAYQPARLVLFQGQTNSPCGVASAESGPFYCPADKTIYIDPAFYDVMARQLRAPGDFAQAYVIAHEVAHHVQNLTGLLVAVNQRRASIGQVEGNQLTVRIELQADCYSGVWVARAERRAQILESGDLEEALRAAYAVGDDVLLRMSGRRVDPTQFTHGSAEQRSRWFKTGLQAGDPRACDTLSQPYEQL